jgi:putative ATPase
MARAPKDRLVHNQGEDLFGHARARHLADKAPLAARMRPRTLEELVGQRHILGPGRLLRRAIQADQLSSLIFYGPPGTGKTTLARIIANSTKAHFTALNAVLAGVADLRQAVAEAEQRLAQHGMRTILFVDEVHRFNKAQQDALLPHVESGTVILIGATTENPYFEVNKALVSRSRIFELRPLSDEEVTEVLRHALADPERGYGRITVRMDEEALAHLARVANGDARAALNALELAVETTPPDDDGAVSVTLAVAEESIQRKAVLYDKEGDVHFDTISAFIKSLRGSDPDAALYWMARMVYAGEDPRFIFRRMLIFAAEDVGLADPGALRVVTAAAQAFDYVGLPEGRFHLAEACLYLATAPKSNTAFAFFDALAAVERERIADVPTPLKDASRDAEGFGHGQGYLYPHAYREHWVAQQYLPESLQGRVFYEPGELGHEGRVRERVLRLREAQLAAAREAAQPQPWPGVDPAAQPAGRHGEWTVRSQGGLSAHLEALRAKVFTLADPKPAHLLLDANAGTGLLLWEALRRCPQGGVWARVESAEEATALTQQAGRFSSLADPVIVHGPPGALAEQIARREAGVRFDRILARGFLARAEDKPRRVLLLAELLAGGGRLVIAETVPRLGGRLFARLAQVLPPPLRERLTAAEDALYADPADPQVNWDAHHLDTWCREVGLAPLAHDRLTGTMEVTITPLLLGRWFGGEAGSEASRIARALGADAAAVREHLARVLLEKPVALETVTVLVLAERSETAKQR